MSETPLGPNDIPQLYECLKTALSQDQHRQKQAEGTLGRPREPTRFHVMPSGEHRTFWSLL